LKTDVGGLPIAFHLTGGDESRQMSTSRSEIYPFRQYVEAGGLMAYGIDSVEIGHRVADLAHKILKGAKPADIPIFQPTKFELTINLKTAKSLGIELPPLLVGRAGNVIE
jgi:putative ABC transport system substrate-binding protein